MFDKKKKFLNFLEGIKLPQNKNLIESIQTAFVAMEAYQNPDDIDYDGWEEADNDDWLTDEAKALDDLDFDFGLSEEDEAEFDKAMRADSLKELR